MSIWRRLIKVCAQGSEILHHVTPIRSSTQYIWLNVLMTQFVWIYLQSDKATITRPFPVQRSRELLSCSTSVQPTCSNLTGWLCRPTFRKIGQGRCFDGIDVWLLVNGQCAVRYVNVLLCRVAELGSLSSGAKMAMKIFVKCVFTTFASNASFLRVIANLQN